jgi:hypothetical protein
MVIMHIGSGGGGVVYVPAQISQAGSTISNDADQLTSETNAFWHSFESTYQGMPDPVRGSLKTFADNSQKALNDLVAQRVSIGHLLGGAASEMEQADAQRAYAFYKNVPLKSLLGH